MSEITSKKCTKCAETLPIQYFSPDKTRRDGYRGVCKTCNKSYPEFKPDFVERGFVPKRALVGKEQRCVRCNEKKDLSLFSKDKHTLTGFRSVCKECRKQDWAQYCARRDARDAASNTGGQ